MKKLLMCSVALGTLAFAAPAFAQEGGVKLELGGWVKAYGVYVDQDTAVGSEERNFDWLQNTEVHFTGETTLDNGLTVGYHVETEADSDDTFEVEESYAYFSGAWGRVNAGAENGANYLLQVAAPSADSNVDGIRAYVNPVNYELTAGTAGLLANAIDGTAADLDGSGAVSAAETTVSNGLGAAGSLGDLFVFDYDDDSTAYSNKLTYLTPVFSGFQAGLSYAPETDEDARSTEGVHADDEAGDYGSAYEIALRYSGEFEGVGFSLGGGYTHIDLEAAQSYSTDADADGVVDAGEDIDGDGVHDGFALDDRQSWNVGLDIDIAAFGLGVAYFEDDLGIDNGADRETWVVGADYTNGPWKLGASYYNQDQELSFITSDLGDLETDRYTGGVTYTYGPGMTFRGSISYIDHDVADSSDVDATSVLLGTQISF